jgi:ubiquinone/menaquinone biosynthesis C-methylase UbiE
MESAEYANLDRVERKHWYYAGKRELVSWWIRRLTPGIAKARLLDCGAGTGLFAQEMSAHLEAHVLDNHEESLVLLRSRFPAGQVHVLSGPQLPFGNASFDVLTALDVLEHIEKDAAAVTEFARVLKPGGLAVITVPASMALWSDWDVSLHHYRRYNRKDLLALFPSADWEPVYVNHVNSLVYPAVWLVRKWQRLMGTRQRMEDRCPPEFLNRLLQRIFVRTGRSRLRAPFGVGLLLVIRRRAAAP